MTLEVRTRTPENLHVGTKDEAFQRVVERTAGTKGWHVLTCDDPWSGRFGFSIWRNLSPEGEPLSEEDYPCEGATEEAFLVSYPAFGIDLKPNIEQTTLDGLVAFIEAHPNACRCDDPLRRWIGFAHFDVSPEVLLPQAEIRYSPLTQLKCGSKAKLDQLQAFRNQAASFAAGLPRGQDAVALCEAITAAAA